MSDTEQSDIDNINEEMLPMPRMQTIRERAHEAVIAVMFMYIEHLIYQNPTAGQFKFTWVKFVEFATSRNRSIPYSDQPNMGNSLHLSNMIMNRLREHPDIDAVRMEDYNFPQTYTVFTVTLV